MNWASAICLLTTIYCSANAINPVILIPGLAASALDLTLTEDADVDPLCQSIGGGKARIFLDETYLIDHPIDCVYQCLQLMYNSTTHTTQNRRGVNISTDYNNIDYVAGLDQLQILVVYKTMIDFLIKRFGYQKNVSIFGTPYDFRKGPLEPEYQIFCALFKQLIVKAYTTNQNQKVILIFHSMGSVVTRYCLRNFTQDFKDKYILVLISLSGVCGGTVKILDILTGVRFSISEFVPNATSSSNISSINYPFVLPLVGQLAANTIAINVVPAYTVLNFTQNPWLSPIPQTFIGNPVIAQTLTKNYTLANMRDYYLDVGGPVAGKIFDDSYPIARNPPPTGVKMWTLYGNGIRTHNKLVHIGPTPQSPKIYLPEYDVDGDGQVPEQGLNCDFLNTSPGDKPIIKMLFKNHNHNSLLTSPDVLESIANIITQESKAAQ